MIPPGSGVIGPVALKIAAGSVTAAALLCAAVLCGGCSGSGPSRRKPAALPIATTSVPSTVVSSTTSVPPDSTAATPECSTPDIRVSWPEERDGASGILYYTVDVANPTTSACHIAGYFGVSAYSPAGTLIVGSDTREADLGLPGTVVLAPGVRAWFEVGFEDSDLQDGGSDCHTPVGSLHLIPPDQTTSLDLATPDPLSEDGYPALCEHRLWVGPVSPPQS